MRERMVFFIGALALITSPMGCLVPQAPGTNIKATADVGEGPEYEAEKMARRGGNDLSSPFNGVVFYGNTDYLEGVFDFPTPGRYAFDIRGASSDGTLAGITVFVNDIGGTTVFFEDKNGESKIAFADVEAAGKHKFRLELTTDVGQNDTYIDKVAVSRHSDLTPAPKFPEKGAFETGEYRNLLVERGYDPKLVQKRIERVYEQLFHGDISNEAIMFPAGANQWGPMAYIQDIGNGDVRSEGMSYGMMLAVQMNRQEDFNALWNWARTYMYKDDPKHPCYGYFSWQMKTDGTAMDEMPAPDGEEYFITSLFFASHRWGDGNGVFNYKQQALELLDKFKNRKAITGKSYRIDPKTKEKVTRTLKGVALVNPEHKMVRFTPDTTNFGINGDHTNPSYHLPAFYELWALWGPEKDKAFWQEAADISRKYFHECTHPKTGLAPDYANFDGTPVSASFNPGSDTFRWDAWRTAMNWGMDAHWFAKDPTQAELTNRIQSFFEGEGLYTYRGCWTIDGKPAEGANGQWHSVGVVATNAATSLAATHPRAWRFIDALWATPVPVGTWRYYDGALIMFGLLHISGNYRIYGPDYLEKAAAEKAATETPTPEETPAESTDAEAEQ